MRVSLRMDGVCLGEHKQKVEAVLGSAAPSLKDDDKLTVNYSCNMAVVGMEMLQRLRAVVEMARDRRVEMNVAGLYQEDMYIFVETGRVVQDLMDAIRDRGVEQ